MTRTFRTIISGISGGAVALTLAAPLWAQDAAPAAPASAPADAHQGHAAPAAAPAPAASGPDAAYAAAMTKMHEGMMIAYTGDADVDFVRGMIPHHQGAIDMARIQLEYGKDPELRKMSEAIIAAQEQEIAEMQAWLAANAPDAANADAAKMESMAIPAAPAADAAPTTPPASN